MSKKFQKLSALVAEQSISEARTNTFYTFDNVRVLSRMQIKHSHS